ncbi:MAG: HAMP domain-containing histidine kinase [Spirulina sp. SIO3F2]|nr:HAMP domain-containing histidine kinase [Spirulina sp. SIO3F2]
MQKADQNGPVQHNSDRWQWFRNLPIQRKQLCGLFTSEIISLVGLVGVSAGLIISGGRSLLTNQAASELAVTEINYNIKIDQMGFGFRGQSDNAAVIAAARAHDAGEALDDELRAQVKQILQNEISARNIEYATLVGSDRRIVVNANRERTHKHFDPHNLVSEVLRNPEQIKTSEVISWAELKAEAPPILTELEEQPAILIRYTITPVLDPENQTVLGALVSGDIVNEKPQITLNTLAVQGGGYSGIYVRRPDGMFALAVGAQSLVDKSRQATLDLPQGNANEANYVLNVTLADNAFLDRAITSPGQIINQRLRVGKQTYTVAAKSIANFAGEPIAILVRGTPEIALNALLRNSLLFQAFVAILALSADVFLAVVLSRVIARPIRRLQTTTQQFTAGNLQVRVPAESTDEVGKLSVQFNTMADQLIEREQTIRQNIAELESTVQELQQTQSYLVQSEKMSGLGQLVAGLTHEFNNPLSFIYGNLRHAKDSTLDLFDLLNLYQQQYPQLTPELEAALAEADLDFLAADLPKMFNSMEYGVQRIQKILESLQGFSHLGQSDLKTVDLNIELDNILELLQSRLVGKLNRPDITVIRHFQSLPLVECYPRQLNQVFINVLSNAIDALDAQCAQSPDLSTPTLSVITAACQECVKVKFQDNGPGIPPDIQSRIFDPFFTTKPVGQGTGLGLSTSYQIVVEQHGGAIACQSTPGEGTTFTVEIPLRLSCAIKDGPGTVQSIE